MEIHMSDLWGKLDTQTLGELVKPTAVSVSLYYLLRLSTSPDTLVEGELELTSRGLS